MKYILWVIEFIIVFFILAPAALGVYVLLSLFFALDSFIKLIKKLYEDRLRNIKTSN